MLIRRFKHKRQFQDYLLGRGGFFSGVSQSAMGACAKGEGGGRMRGVWEKEN